MRKTTRSKYYGRNEVAAGLRSLVTEVGIAIDELTQPVQLPVAERLRMISAVFKRLASSCEHYKFGGKRLPAKLKKEQANIQALLEEAMSVPVFQEEKIIAKARRKRNV